MRDLTPAELDRVEAAIRLGERSTFLSVTHEPMLVFEVGWADLRVAQVLNRGNGTDWSWQVTLFVEVPAWSLAPKDLDRAWPLQLATLLQVCIGPRMISREQILATIDRNIPGADGG